MAVIPAQGMAVSGEDVRLHLLGIMPLIEAVATAEQTEKLLQQAIDSAENGFQHDLQYALKKQVIKMYPEEGAVYDEEEDPLDYHIGDMSKKTLPTWLVRKRPIISVERVRLAFNNMAGVLEIPVTNPAGPVGNTGWLKIHHELGRISVVPLGMPSSMVAGYGMWFAPLMETTNNWTVIPQFVCIDYTCGFEDPRTDSNLDDVRWHIGMDAAKRVMQATQRLIVQQTTQDGFAQSFQPITQTIEDYRKDVAEFYADFQRKHMPPQIRVI